MEERAFLQNYNITEYERPSLTADIVLFALDNDQKMADIRKIGINGLQVLLIRRGEHPYKGKWALPGGFCKPSETIMQTAKRELFEETNIGNTSLRLIGTYSNPDRDPRGWIISNAFMGMTTKEFCNLRADTDAWEARWFTITDVYSATEISHDDSLTQKTTHSFKLIKGEEALSISITEVRKPYDTFTETYFEQNESDLAFDHGQIIGETFLSIRNSLKYDIRPVFDLFPEQFTLGELCKACEVIINKEFINFHRTIKPYVIDTGEIVKRGGFRPAKLYKRNPDMFL